MILAYETILPMGKEIQIADCIIIFGLLLLSIYEMIIKDLLKIQRPLVLQINSLFLMATILFTFSTFISSDSSHFAFATLSPTYINRAAVFDHMHICMAKNWTKRTQKKHPIATIIPKYVVTHLQTTSSPTDGSGVLP